MTVDSFTSSFHKYLMHFYRRICESSSFGPQPCCNSWKACSSIMYALSNCV